MRTNGTATRLIPEEAANVINKPTIVCPKLSAGLSRHLFAGRNPAAEWPPYLLVMGSMACASLGPRQSCKGPDAAFHSQS
jgi:hypothetical protein